MVLLVRSGIVRLDDCVAQGRVAGEKNAMGHAGRTEERGIGADNLGFTVQREFRRAFEHVKDLFFPMRMRSMVRRPPPPSSSRWSACFCTTRRLHPFLFVWAWVEPHFSLPRLPAGERKRRFDPRPISRVGPRCPGSAEALALPRQARQGPKSAKSDVGSIVGYSKPAMMPLCGWTAVVSSTSIGRVPPAQRMWPPR